MTNKNTREKVLLKTKVFDLELNTPIVLLSGCVGFGEEYTRINEFSNNDVEIVLGFKNRSGEILEDCIEENSNSTTKFSQID